MKKNIPILNAVLTNEDEIELISFVDSPAIMRNFVYFNDNENKDIFQIKLSNEEQRIVVAPAMIPDILIYRNQNGKEFYTRFSKEEIKKIQYQYAKDGNFNKSNLNHKMKLDGIVMLENWIKESSNDKSSDYGFSDLPVGTWFTVYKIDNEDLWKKIKAGEINGLSIEGYLTYEDSNISVEQSYKSQLLDILKPKKESYKKEILKIFGKQ